MPFLDFGTKPRVNATHSITGSIEITCNPGTPYSVGLDGGWNGDGTASGRVMLRFDDYLAAAPLPYQLYTSSGTVWGDQPTERVSATAPASGVNTHTVRAEVIVSASTPESGFFPYDDFLTATVYF